MAKEYQSLREWLNEKLHSDNLWYQATNIVSVDDNNDDDVVSVELYRKRAVELTEDIAPTGWFEIHLLIYHFYGLSEFKVAYNFKWQKVEGQRDVIHALVDDIIDDLNNKVDQPEKTMYVYRAKLRNEFERVTFKELEK